MKLSDLPTIQSNYGEVYDSESWVVLREVDCNLDIITSKTKQWGVVFGMKCDVLESLVLIQVETHEYF